jgi:hypothetical protein
MLVYVRSTTLQAPSRLFDMSGRWKMQKSTASSAEARLTGPQAGMLALAALLAAGIYLIAAWRTVGLGFPLDDSWIHLTYARNLAELGRWVFLPGQPSAGSTSPLWTALLVPGFILRVGPYLWAYALGVACLFGLGAITEHIIRQQVPQYSPSLPWAGLLIVTEWHFVWAAVSGMETLLYVLLVIILFAMLLRESQNFVGQGVLIGLSVWVRPDAVTLLAPAALAALLMSRPPREKVKSLLLLGGGFMAVILPYVLMNLALSDRPFPNTFYAKQAEYYGWRVSPFATKIENLSLVFLGGVALVLLPAVIGAIFLAVRGRRWPVLLAVTWAAGYAWLYTSRLPVYQHGRYIMPAMAVFLLVGLLFLAAWVAVPRERAGRMLRFAWISAIATVSSIFYVYGASVYASDVALIQHEMVASARWVAENVSPDQLVAAHDIGALGYFAPHIRLLDLAGLVSPDVVPFINDEELLAAYIQSRGGAFVVIVPHRYPFLAKIGQAVFTAPASGDEAADQAMVVYHWMPP